MTYFKVRWLQVGSLVLVVAVAILAAAQPPGATVENRIVAGPDALPFGAIARMFQAPETVGFNALAPPRSRLFTERHRLSLLAQPSRETPDDAEETDEPEARSAALAETMAGRYLVVRTLLTRPSPDRNSPRPGMQVEEIWELSDRGSGVVTLTTQAGSVNGRYIGSGCRFQFRIPVLDNVTSDYTIDLYPGVNGGVYGTEEIVIIAYNAYGNSIRTREAWKLRGVRR